jgi:hypothetical protein
MLSATIGSLGFFMASNSEQGSGAGPAPSPWGRGNWGCVFWAVVVSWFVGSGGTDAWHSKLRYSIQYDVPYDKVTKPNKPHDCDWLKAPIGDKECHYEIRVYTVRTAADTRGNAIISYDEGATWTRCIRSGADTCTAPSDGIEPYPEQPATPVVVRSVALGWEKTDEE